MAQDPYPANISSAIKMKRMVMMELDRYNLVGAAA
jgi:hypothetical protein